MITENDAKIYREAIEQLTAIKVMASSNFPRDTGINVSTAGPGPSASCKISVSALTFLLRAAQEALEKKGGRHE